jgi:ABC-type multidrug transport system ATPase subunit
MVKKESKTILQRQEGLIQDSTFTAILGPSGSGKTTLLNFLSGRLMSTNLTVEGGMRFNRESIKSVEPYCKQIGYVMQEDALLPTLTPRECFQFAADLRLTASKEEKQ